MSSVHWQGVTLGQLCEQFVTFNQAGEELPPLSVTKDNGVVLQSEKFKKRIAIKDTRKYKVIALGEFVFDPMSLYYGAIGWQRSVARGVVSPAYVTFRANARVLPSYLWHLVKSSRIQAEFTRRTEGGNLSGKRRKIDWDSFSEIPVGLPPLEDQASISAALDAADAAVAASQAFEAEALSLRATQLACILRRGLAQAREGQDTDTGEGWRLKRGEEIFVAGGGHGPADVRFDARGDTLFVKVDDLNAPLNALSVREAALRFHANQNPKIKIYGPGSLVFAKRGEAIHKNRVRVLAAPCAVDPNLMVLTPKPDVDVQYLCAMLTWVGLSKLGDDSGIPQINNKHVYPHVFPMPKMRTQRDVALISNGFSRAIVAEAEARLALHELKRILADELTAAPHRLVA